MDASQVENKTKGVVEMNAAMKKTLLLIFGSLALIGGVALVLFWWKAVALLFKGVVGMILAVVGLVMLVMAND